MSGVWDDAYRGQEHCWWHLSEPSPELVEAVKEGWLGRGRILDVGCGLGTEVGYLARQGFRTIGIDLAEEAIRHAISRHPNAMFLVADGMRLPCPDRAFEAAIDRGCFRYLQPEGRKAYEAELRRVLHPGGRLLLRACLRSAGVRNDITPAVARAIFARWHEVSLRRAWIPSDTRSMVLWSFASS